MKLAACSPRSGWKYLLWTFGLSWGVWIPLLFLSRRHEEFQNLLVLGAFGPGLAAVIVPRRGARSSRRATNSQILCFVSVLLTCLFILVGHHTLWEESSLSVGVFVMFFALSAVPAGIAVASDVNVKESLRSLSAPKTGAWHLFALVLMPTLLFASAAILQGLGGAVHQQMTSTGSGSLLLLVLVEFGYTFFFGGGLTEEPGWRGFLLPRLQTRLSPLSASLLVWIPWALWHAPLDFAGYAGPSFGDYFRTRVVLLLSVSVILTFIYNRTGGSILAAALFHSVYNIAPDFIPFTNLSPWLVVAAAITLVYAGKMWRIRPNSGFSMPSGSERVGESSQRF